MTQADDYILEMLEDTGIVLSPQVIAYNIDYSRNYINDRMSYLREAGLVDRVDEGLYQITDRGKKYLSGELDADDLESLV